MEKLQGVRSGERAGNELLVKRLIILFPKICRKKANFLGLYVLLLRHVGTNHNCFHFHRVAV
jgi:hypothetical protein